MKNTTNTAVVWKYLDNEQLALLVRDVSDEELLELEEEYDKDDTEVQVFDSLEGLDIKEGATYSLGYDPLDW